MDMLIFLIISIIFVFIALCIGFYFGKKIKVKEVKYDTEKQKLIYNNLINQNQQS